MSHRTRRLCRRVASAAALWLLLAAPDDASARKFQMSGSWFYRTGLVFIPLQFIYSYPGMTHASMGSLTSAFFVPNGPVPGEGVVTATGSAPATLRLPRHRFVEDAMALVPFNQINLIQITTNFGIDAPYAAATLAPGGGPGSFTWCPTDPACLAGGGMLSTDRPQGAGPRGGRVIYRAGANRFGGAMQMGLRRGGTVSAPFGSGSPMRVGHVRFFGLGTTLRSLAPGGLGAADVPATEMAYLAAGFVTQPTMFPMGGLLILHPGPKVTTMLGTTLMGAGIVLYFPVIATGPMGTKASQFTTHYGFARTTGIVIAQQTAGSGGDDFFTVMGSDARTPLGAGNIALVAGGVSFRDTQLRPLGLPRQFATFDKVTLTLAPPTPSLSPAGVAAGAALVLLAVGYALRGRRARR